MKVSKQSLEFMATHITTFLTNVAKQPLDKEYFKAGGLDVAQKHHIWAMVSNNIKFSDNNANVLTVNGKRMFEHNPNFDFYVDGTNDKTIQTALDYVFANMIGDIKPAGNIVKRITDK